MPIEAASGTCCTASKLTTSMPPSSCRREDPSRVSQISIMLQPCICHIAPEPRLKGHSPICQLNLAQLAFCDEHVSRIDPKYAAWMGYYPWMVFWHQKMMFVRQFAIAVQRAGLVEISVVTFSNENHGSPVDVVVGEMYDAFAEGREAAEQQLEDSRTQSANHQIGTPNGGN